MTLGVRAPRLARPTPAERAQARPLPAERAQARPLPAERDARAADAWWRIGFLSAGLVAAVGLRRAVDPWPGATSVAAAMVFVLVGSVVLLLARVLPGPDGTRSGPDAAADSNSPSGRRERSVAGQLLLGLLGAAGLCVGPLVVHLRSPGGALPPEAFPRWAIVVTAVAVVQELLLRGRLWDAVSAAFGAAWAPRADLAALAVTTVVFAVIHLPFYGLAALPVDLAAGVVLGGLRLLTGGLIAPALAHVAADLTGWWLP